MRFVFFLFSVLYWRSS